ncbi:MAG: hypothetical protein ACUVXA_02135 [Candidatus Jordarchaeum sp.]|uniref:hypothetical protein n=1 Tax=Candidatus Jordarchaeum sp. TaxID=2823881 RepID=UPI00404B393C
MSKKIYTPSIRIIVEYFHNPNSIECKNYMKIVVNPLMKKPIKEVEWKISNIFDPKVKKEIEKYKINLLPAIVINKNRILIGYKPQEIVKSIIEEEIEKEHKLREVKLK